MAACPVIKKRGVNSADERQRCPGWVWSPNECVVPMASFKRKVRLIHPTTSSALFDVKGVFREILKSCLYMECHKSYRPDGKPFFSATLIPVEAHKDYGGCVYTEREATAINAIAYMVVRFSGEKDEGMGVYEWVLCRRMAFAFGSMQAMVAEKNASRLEKTAANQRRVLLDTYRERIGVILCETLKQLEKPTRNPFFMLRDEENPLVEAVIECVVFAVNLLGGLHRKAFEFSDPPETVKESSSPLISLEEVVDVYLDELDKWGILEWLNEACRARDVFGQIGGQLDADLVLSVHLNPPHESFQRLNH